MGTTKKFVTAAFLVLTAMSPVRLSAETAICSGLVTNVAYHAPDGFFVGVEGMNIIKVCSPQETFFRTGSESCKLIATLATTARATGKHLQLYIDNAPSTSCQDITPWFSADIRFVQLMP